MATRIWRGGASPTAQVQTYALAGTWEANDKIRAIVGAKVYDFTAGSTNTTAIVSAMVTAWNALSSTLYPEFSRITASGNSATFTLTADDAGLPFTVSLTPLESDGTGADSQTIEGATAATTGTVNVACTGPNHFSNANNWTGGAVPVNSDDVFYQDTNISCQFDIDQNAITLASLTVDQSFTGDLGLPRTRGTGATAYPEYRETYLKISAATVTIGNGDGAGSGRLKLNTGAVPATLNINGSGTPSTGELRSISWLGANSGNVVNVNKGSVAAASIAGEAATIGTLRQGFRTSVNSDTDVFLGTGVTLTTVNKSGGTLTINSNVTTLTQTGGETILAAGTPGTLNVWGGALRYRSAGNATTMNLAGELDCRSDLRGRQIGTLNIFKGAIIRDPFETISSAAFILKGCMASEVTLDIGTDITLTRS